jgi:hypothetical protein
LNCLTCKKDFTSDRNKKFCCLDCYLNSDRYKQIMASRKTGTEGQCLHCSLPVYSKKSYTRKFCNSICYRQYKAARFDREVASVATLTQVNNFDEFLTREVLHCPIVGCGWSGDHLSMHMNQVHAIKAIDFKKMAGFNLTSGIISLPLKKHMQETSVAAQTIEYARAKRGNPDTSKQSDYHSMEEREARLKAKALRGPVRLEIECHCGQCGNKFKANYQQSLRARKGSKVFCSDLCRQTHNSRTRFAA